MDNKKKLGIRIKELRKQRGLTQEQVAEKIQLEQNTISVIESGRNFPTLVTLEKIANVLQVDLSDFFNYETSEDTEVIKKILQEKFQLLNDTQIRQVYKYVKNIVI